MPLEIGVLPSLYFVCVVLIGNCAQIVPQTSTWLRSGREFPSLQSGLSLRGGGRKYRERVAQYHEWKQRLWKAAASGDQKAIKKVIGEGGNVNVADRDGWTACHWAAAKGHSEAIAVLSKLGADINAVDNHKSTPLHWAAANGHRAVIEILCSLGAKLNPKDAVSFFYSHLWTELLPL